MLLNNQIYIVLKEVIGAGAYKGGGSWYLSVWIKGKEDPLTAIYDTQEQQLKELKELSDALDKLAARDMEVN